MYGTISYSSRPEFQWLHLSYISEVLQMARSYILPMILNTEGTFPSHVYECITIWYWRKMYIHELTFLQRLSEGGVFTLK